MGSSKKKHKGQTHRNKHKRNPALLTFDTSDDDVSLVTPTSPETLKDIHFSISNEQTSSPKEKQVCPKCQNITNRLSNIENQLEKMHDLNKHLLTLVENSYAECSSLRAVLNLQITNNQVREQGASQPDCLSEEKTKCFLPTQRKQQTAPNTKSNSNVTSSPVASTSKWSISPKSNGNLSNNRVEQHGINQLALKKDHKQRVKQTKSAEPSVSKSTSQEVEIHATKPKPKLTIIGSSNIQNTGPAISSKIKEMDVCVLSTSGMTTDAAESQIDKILEEHKNDDTVVLQLGTNDILKRAPYSIAISYGNIIDKIAKKNPESKIAICAVPRRLNIGSEEFNKQVNELNNALKLLCTRDNHLNFWDVNPGASWTFYKYDGLHLNHTGTQIYSNLLANKVKHQINFPLPVISNAT